MHTNADTAPPGLSDGAYDAPYRTRVDPKSVPRPNLVDLHQGKGLMIIAQRRALGDVAWAGAGLLGPRCVLPVESQPLPMYLCCAVMIQSPHVLLKGRVHSCLRVKRPPEDTGWRPSQGTAPDRQRSGWRPPRSGDQDREERAIACEKSGYVWPRPRRRRGAQAQSDSTFTQPRSGGGCRVRHASCPALRPLDFLTRPRSRSFL